MKRVAVVGLVLAFAVAAQAGPTVTATGGSGYGVWQTGSGGEFTLQPSSDCSWVLSLYDDSTRNQGNTTGTFQSFCMEHGEYIYPWTTHDVVFNSKVVMGGIGGGGPNGDPLSVGTAWLYHKFQNETLSDYDFDNTGVGRHASAAALQNTIWWLEGEAGDPGAGNAFRNAVVAKFADPMADNLGRYPVAVLNLYALGHAGEKDADYLRQDMLVCVPCVPAPAALLLAGMGTGLVGWLRRRRTL